MNAYDIARIIRSHLDSTGRPCRHTPETGTFAIASGGEWAIVLQPFGQNIELACSCRKAFSIMTAARLAEYADRLNNAGLAGRFSVRGHETEQGKLQFHCRMVKSCGDDFSAEVFAGMLADAEELLRLTGLHLTDAAEGTLSPEEAVSAIVGH